MSDDDDDDDLSSISDLASDASDEPIAKRGIEVIELDEDTTQRKRPATRDDSLPARQSVHKKDSPPVANLVDSTQSEDDDSSSEAEESSSADDQPEPINSAEATDEASTTTRPHISPLPPVIADDLNFDDALDAYATEPKSHRLWPSLAGFNRLVTRWQPTRTASPWKPLPEPPLFGNFPISAGTSKIPLQFSR